MREQGLSTKLESELTTYTAPRTPRLAKNQTRVYIELNEQ